MDSRVLTPVETKTLACMRELLGPIPGLRKRYTPQVILLAMLTHAGIGLRDQLAAGEISRAEVSRACRDFRAMALGLRKGSGKGPRRPQGALMAVNRKSKSKTL